MNRINQESVAGRFQSSPYDAGYECEPPPDVRAELNRPKRARILGPLRAVTHAPRCPLYVLLLAAGITIVGLLVTRHQERPTKQSEQSLAPQARLRRSRVCLHPLPVRP